MLELVKVFDRFPPRGKRRRQYEIWRQAVIEYAKPGPRRQIHDRLRSSARSSLERAHIRLSAAAAFRMIYRYIVRVAPARS